MNKLLLSASIVLLNISPLAAQSQQSQTEPHGFHDIQLGMSIAEFKSEHPAPDPKKYGPLGGADPGQAGCSGSRVGQRKKDLENAARGIAWCSYGETYLNVRLQVQTAFVDGKLAVIEVEPPYDTPGCFAPPPPPGKSTIAIPPPPCQKDYLPLFLSLTGKLGTATRIVSTNENLRFFDIRRWESDSSVAEFQDHMCGPWDGTDVGWSKAILEILEGTYCKRGDTLSSRQPVMFYLEKELSRTLAARLEKSAS